MWPVIEIKYNLLTSINHYYQSECIWEVLKCIHRRLNFCLFHLSTGSIRVSDDDNIKTNVTRMQVRALLHGYSKENLKIHTGVPSLLSLP